MPARRGRSSGLTEAQGPKAPSTWEPRTGFGARVRDLRKRIEGGRVDFARLRAHDRRPAAANGAPQLTGDHPALRIGGHDRDRPRPEPEQAQTSVDRVMALLPDDDADRAAGTAPPITKLK